MYLIWIFFQRSVPIQTKFLAIEFGCHIDAAEQQRTLNFELVVSDQLFSVILVPYN